MSRRLRTSLTNSSSQFSELSFLTRTRTEISSWSKSKSATKSSTRSTLCSATSGKSWPKYICFKLNSLIIRPWIKGWLSRGRDFDDQSRSPAKISSWRFYEKFTLLCLSFNFKTLTQKIGQVLDYCQEYLGVLNELMKNLTPLAVRAAMLMTLSLKMCHVSKNYQFSSMLVEFIFMHMPQLVNKDTQVNSIEILKSSISIENKIKIFFSNRNFAFQRKYVSFSWK